MVLEARIAEKNRSKWRVPEIGCHLRFCLEGDLLKEVWSFAISDSCRISISWTNGKVWTNHGWWMSLIHFGKFKYDRPLRTSARQGCRVVMMGSCCVGGATRMNSNEFHVRLVYFMSILGQAIFSLRCSKNILREPQHTAGAYPRHPQNTKWKEFRNIKWFRVWGMLQGYVGKFLETYQKKMWVTPVVHQLPCRATGNSTPINP